MTTGITAKLAIGSFALGDLANVMAEIYTRVNISHVEFQGLELQEIWVPRFVLSMSIIPKNLRKSFKPAFIDTLLPSLLLFVHVCVPTFLYAPVRRQHCEGRTPSDRSVVKLQSYIVSCDFAYSITLSVFGIL